MERVDNYALQAKQAKQHFLTYDQNALIAKLDLQQDSEYLYVNLLCQLYRINRKTGDMHRRLEESWVAADSHSEVMTLLDLVCDSRRDRYITGRWKNMQSFGRLFHSGLLEKSGILSRCALMGIPKASTAPAAPWEAKRFRGRISATASPFLRDFASVSSSGTEMMSFLPGFATSGMKMPTVT